MAFGTSLPISDKIFFTFWVLFTDKVGHFLPTILCQKKNGKKVRFHHDIKVIGNAIERLGCSTVISIGSFK
jgi:hypothetical protein